MNDGVAPRVAEKQVSLTGSRSRAPVFVLGCPRSGTTLLYHMLLSSGGFAVYRSESHALNLLEPRFGDLSIACNKRKLMRAWLNTKLFQRSGLDAQEIEAKVMRECTNGGEFLRIVMEEIARKQNVERWADCTPEHLLFLHRIKQTIPDALIIHIIRDGRDVALSMDKQRWIRPLPGDAKRHLVVAGLYWEWIVNRGREEGPELGDDYCEVHFEELVENPRSVLGRLGSFIEHDLDYDRILKVGIGSVGRPNSSFESGLKGGRFNPVARWKKILSLEEVRTLEGLVGGTLEGLGYSLAAVTHREKIRLALRTMRSRYRCYFDLKLWTKTKTPVGKLLVSKDLSWL